jgi:arylsulfatase I/J
MQPHLIFALGDDVGWSNVGWNNPQVLTPHMDSLRAGGLALEQHYAFKFCSPSRASFLSGRLPVHVNQENSATEQEYAGIPLGMTLFSERLAQAGYKTAHIGKWHVGQATPQHLPHGRGFQHALSYFNFGEDYYTQIRGGRGSERPGCGRAIGAVRAADGHDCAGVDLWKDTAPAYGLNGTMYGGFLYSRDAVSVIESHDPASPLFMFVAWQNNHPPLEVPGEYVDRYPAGPRRTLINGMSAFLDESMANLTGALRRTGLPRARE